MAQQAVQERSSSSGRPSVRCSTWGTSGRQEDRGDAGGGGRLPASGRETWLPGRIWGDWSRLWGGGAPSRGRILPSVMSPQMPYAGQGQNGQRLTECQTQETLTEC